MLEQKLKCDKPSGCYGGRGATLEDAIEFRWYEIAVSSRPESCDLRIEVRPFSGINTPLNGETIMHSCRSHLDDVVQGIASDFYLAVEKLHDEENKTAEALTGVKSSVPSTAGDEAAEAF
jgi:hypothetical protein